MNNLRFYVSNKSITKCEYKQLPSHKGEIDLILYNDIFLPEKELREIFRALVDSKITGQSIKYAKYTLYEFKVNDKIMAEIIRRSNQYKREIISKNDFNNIEEMKEKNAKFTAQKEKKTKKKRKDKINRNKKFVRRRAIAGILALITLAGAGYVAVKGLAKDKEEPEVVDTPPAIVVTATDTETKDTDYIIVDESPTLDTMVTEIQENLTHENIDYTFRIYADDWTSGSKYVNCYNNYYPLIEKYANMYGLPPELALAIACHERGEHSSVVDSGGGLGLFQIQLEVWDGNNVSAYNFDTESWETYTVHADVISNVEYNIKVGMMILQTYMDMADYNVAMGVQAYNFGFGGVTTSMRAASNNLGIDMETLKQFGNTDWFDYRTANRSSAGYQMGDPNYVENVFKFIHDGQTLVFKRHNQEDLVVKYDNLNYDEYKSLI